MIQRITFRYIFDDLIRTVALVSCFVYYNFRKEKFLKMTESSDKETIPQRKTISRRSFLKTAGVTAAGAVLSGCVDKQALKNLQETANAQTKIEEEKRIIEEKERATKEAPLMLLEEKRKEAKNRVQSLEKALLKKGILGQVKPVGGDFNPQEKIRVRVTAKEGLFLRALPKVEEDTKITFLDLEGQPRRAFCFGEMPAGMLFEVTVGQDLWYSVRPSDLKLYSMCTVLPNDRIVTTSMGEQYVFFCAREGNTSYVGDIQTIKHEW